MGRLYKEFQAVDCEILLILGGSIDQARRYTDSLKLPFPVLADPDRRVYQLYGLEKVLLVQRTASIIIDRQGIVRYLRVVLNPFTWLKESRELLQVVKSLPE